MSALHSICARLRETPGHDLIAETLKEYVKRLRNDGVEFLGKGSLATTFVHPKHKNIAVKLYTANSGFDVFLRFCLANPQNPYCPKIYEVTTVEKALDTELPKGPSRVPLKAVFMERLRPLRASEYKKFALEVGHLGGLSWPSTTLMSYGKDVWPKVAAQKQDPNLAKVARWLCKTVYYSRNRKFMSDVHEQNLMARLSDGHVVFSDPIWSA